MIVAVGQDKSREAFYTTPTFIHPKKMETLVDAAFSILHSTETFCHHQTPL